MSEFRPLNLAQLYQSADASVAQAMQTNLLVLQSTRMKDEYDREDALRALAKNSTTTNPDGTRSFDLKSFAQGAYSIDPNKAVAMERAQADARKTAVETENLQSQIDERRFTQAANRLKHMNEASTVPFMKYKELIDKGVPDAEARQQVQPMYQAAILALRDSGMFTTEQLSKFDIPPQFDPAKAEAGMRQVLGAKESLAQFWEKKKFGLDEKKFDETRRHNQATEEQAGAVLDETKRHNKATEGQAAASLSQSQQQHIDSLKSQGIEIKQNEDGTYVRIDKTTGTAQPVRDPGTGQVIQGKSKEGSQEERVAAGFASRMAASEKIMAGIKVGDQKTGFFEGIVGAVPFTGEWQANWIRDADRQKALQAQRDWVRAKLRKESGAVIADEEMAMEIRTYFPQPGDSAAVVKQKAESRKQANEAMAKAAGKAYKPADAPKSEGDKPKGPAAGTVQDGYRFKGGDPSKRENWEKV